MLPSFLDNSTPLSVALSLVFSNCTSDTLIDSLNSHGFVIVDPIAEVSIYPQDITLLLSAALSLPNLTSIVGSNKCSSSLLKLLLQLTYVQTALVDKVLPSDAVVGSKLHPLIHL